MAFKLGDRARETSTAPGTGSFTVNGAVQGAQSLASVMTANADTAWYFATNGTAWEVGTLTRTSATVYARGTPFASSNAGALVNFSSGLVDISLDLPASVVEMLNLAEITVASATTTDIGAVQGGKIVISGTVTITGLGTSTNKLRFVRFSGALTLTHNGTSLILPGGVNIATVAGDTAIFASDSSGNWRCYSYMRGSFTTKAPTTQPFTSGSGTYTTPTGVKYIRVRGVGGGGGGGGTGTAGSPGSGGGGGNTTFGSHAANGGGGGTVATGGGGGNAGTGGTASIAAGGLGEGVSGGSGGWGNNSTAGPAAAGGCGGNGRVGGGGGGGGGAQAGLAGATNSGGGGGGAGTAASASGTGGGGGGGGGFDIIIAAPAATYSYAVGAAGTAGAAGSNGQAGGAGGSGNIVVDEFYN